MGQAKLRGTFEQRKAQAISAGRVKTPTQSKGSYSPHPYSMLAMSQNSRVSKHNPNKHNIMKARKASFMQMNRDRGS